MCFGADGKDEGGADASTGAGAAGVVAGAGADAEEVACSEFAGFCS